MADRYDWDRDRDRDRESDRDRGTSRGEWDRGRESRGFGNQGGHEDHDRENRWSQGQGGNSTYGGDSNRERGGDWNRERSGDWNREREGWRGGGREEWQRQQPWAGERSRGEHARYTENAEQGDWGRQGSWGTYGNRNDYSREGNYGNWGNREGSPWEQGRNEWNQRRGPGRREFGEESIMRDREFGREREEQGQYSRSGPYQGGMGSFGGGMGSYGGRGQFSGRGPKGWQRSDERIREDICERLNEHPHVDATEIEINVKNGEVTLSGSAHDRNQKRMAEEAAEQVSGVKDVHNQIRVQGAGQQQQSLQTTGSGSPSGGKQK